VARLGIRKVVMVACTLLLVTLAPAPAAGATPSDAAAQCKHLDEFPIFEGTTRGACVNILGRPGGASPHANNDEAGICGWPVFRGELTIGECIQLLDPGERPFEATMSQTYSFAPIFIEGSGTAMRLGAVTEAGEITAGNFEDFPLSFDLVTATVVTSSRSGEQLSLETGVRFTDTDSPPQGINYRQSGSVIFQAGTGRFAQIHGSADVNGICVSPMGDPRLHCETAWRGTIDF
jgi:hypothetical protein